MNATLLRASAAMLAAGLIACGTTGPAAPSTILVTQDSAGKTIQAHAGDTIRVQLEESFPVPGVSLTWDVTSNAPSVLKLQKITRDPAQRPVKGTVSYTADFTAVSSGQATLFARGSQRCEAMPTCPQKDFTVTVAVT